METTTERHGAGLFRKPPVPPHIAVMLECVLVFAIAAALVWPLFRIGFTDNWGSIESTFIADGRFLRDHWPHPQWQPLWYGGTRFDYIYPPALRYGTAGLSMLLGVETVRAYHIYTAFFYAAGIMGVFLLARLGTGSRAAGWLAAAATALLSPSYLLLPAIRADGLHTAPWRLRVLVRYGEGPHITALAVLGFALVASFYAVRNGKPAMIALAAALAALTVSNNFYGATSLAIFFPMLVFAVWLTHRDGRAWLRGTAIAVLAYGLTAWWLTPSYLRVTLDNLRLVSRPGDTWSAAVAAVVAAGFGLLALRFARGRRELAYTVFVAGSCVFFALNVLGNFWFDFRIAGEPARLVPELDLVLILAAVEVFRRIKTRRAVLACLVLLAFVPARFYLRHPWRMFAPEPDYKQRVEYRVQDWIARNLPGSRVLVTGSTRFWFDTWHDLAQIGGGSEQGVLNQTAIIPMWQVILGDTAELGKLWLQAVGVDALVVHGSQSPELYHDIQHPRRFEGALPVLFDDGHDTAIYRIPRRYPGLARVVDRQSLMGRPVFREGMDQLPNVKAYAALVEQGPDSPAAFRWEGTDAMRVHARTAAGQGVLVQVAYDPAWHAFAAGRELPVRKDPFGQMLVETPPGEHDVRLVFETPFENRAGAAVSLASVIAAFGMVFIRTGRASRARPRSRPA